METVLFCIPIKKGCLDQYKGFVKEALAREDEYKDMLSRYDIHCVKIWHENLGGQDYAFTCHDIGPEFDTRIANWDNSEHPFDQWFGGWIMEVYDIQDIKEMKRPPKLADFKV